MTFFTKKAVFILLDSRLHFSKNLSIGAPLVEAFFDSPAIRLLPGPFFIIRIRD